MPTEAALLGKFSDAGELLSIRHRNREASEIHVRDLGTPHPSNPLASCRFFRAPIVQTREAIVARLGPSAQAAAGAEYAKLVANRREIRFDTAAQLAQNKAQLYRIASAFQRNIYDVATVLHSTPRPGIPDDWGANGWVAFRSDADFLAYSYVNNNTNACRVFVDGCALIGADESGQISNTVASDSNARQWVCLYMPSRRERVFVMMANNIASLVLPPGASYAPVETAGRAIVFGDSLAGRINGGGEAQNVAQALTPLALASLHYDAIDATCGGTGWLNTGGGAGAGKGSYLDYINLFSTVAAAAGCDLTAYNRVVLSGTGNDANSPLTVAQYATVIQRALDVFSRAVVIVTSCPEGFSPAGLAKATNDAMFPATQQFEFGRRVKWVPIDSVYHPAGLQLWSGTGSTFNPQLDGDADIYLGSPAQAPNDRHPNRLGVIKAANLQAVEMRRTGAA